jgi:hypothetical protein
MGEHPSPEGFVVLASLPTRRDAERLVASLGHGFRTTARGGNASALVISGNPDGSLKLTQSRTLTAGDFTAAVLRVSASVAAGFMGSVAALKGTRQMARGVHKHEGRVGSDEQAAHAILSKAGEHSAVVLFQCHDEQTWQEIRGRAADRSIASWSAPMTEFLAQLDPGSPHDWVRAALGTEAGPTHGAGGGDGPVD